MYVCDNNNDDDDDDDDAKTPSWASLYEHVYMLSPLLRKGETNEE